MGKDYMILKGENSEITGAPAVVKILPLGLVKTRKGNFTVDKESFLEMQQHFQSRGNDIVVDYEHQTLKDVQAPAGGWIKELLLQDDAIAAKVEWTDKAKAYLEGKEYRYLSPVVQVKKGRALRLHSVALTNSPAIDGMFSINSENFEGEEKMELEKLAKLLGLSEGATEEEVLAMLAAMVTEVKDLKIKAEGAQQACKDSETLETQVKVLSDKLAQRDAAEVVQLALKGGKITAAQKDWAVTYALKDPQGFGDFVKQAPQAVPMGEIVYAGGATALTDKPLDSEALYACKLMGLSEDDVKKFGGK